MVTKHWTSKLTCIFWLLRLGLFIAVWLCKTLYWLCSVTISKAVYRACCLLALDCWLLRLPWDTLAPVYPQSCCSLLLFMMARMISQSINFYSVALKTSAMLWPASIVWVSHTITTIIPAGFFGLSLSVIQEYVSSFTTSWKQVYRLLLIFELYFQFRRWTNMWKY